MSDSESISQDEVTRLLAEAENAGAGAVDQVSIDSLLNQAQSALSSIDEPAAPLPPGVTPFEFKNLAGANAANESASLDMLRDVQLDLKIELGRTQMHLEDVLRLKQGAVVTLDKLAGDPVDIYANGQLIARGEVLVLNDNFCVRVAELISGDDAAA
jgi:flagellar motor switch protein FliN/FliY